MREIFTLKEIESLRFVYSFISESVKACLQRENTGGQSSVVPVVARRNVKYSYWISCLSLVSPPGD